MPDMSAAAPATPGGPAPYLWCSDCRAPMREQYYALNERPICAKCRPTYAQRIARTDGPGAIWRVGLHGALVAVAGVAALTGVGMLFPPARIFLLVPIGYLIGKRMMTLLDGYSARRYQYLAVGLTYACFLLGFALPAAMEERAARERRAENRAKVQGTMATQTDALRSELGEMGMPTPEMAAAAAGENGDGAAGAAASAAGDDDIGPGPGLALVMLLFFPFIALIQFGLAFSAVGYLSLGYGLYQAWTRTDGQGMHLRLAGPFRVGRGPIPAR